MTLDDILADVGVVIIPPNQTRHSGETCAASTITKIYRRHGDAHAALVLRLLFETNEANRNAIVGPALWAISDVLLAHPALVNAGLGLFEAFDSIDLTALLTIAKANQMTVPLRPAVATMIYTRLSKLLEQPKQRYSPLRRQRFRLAVRAAA